MLFDITLILNYLILKHIMATKYKGSNKEVTALNAFININRAVESLGSRLTENYTSMGLTSSQFGVLEALFHLGPLCQKEIAEKLLVSGGNITMVIDNLEKRKLVFRKRSDSDRRFYNVDLTKKGRDIISKLFPKHVKNVVKEFSVLTSEEQLQLRNICKKLGKGDEEKN